MNKNVNKRLTGDRATASGWNCENNIPLSVSTVSQSQASSGLEQTVEDRMGINSEVIDPNWSYPYCIQRKIK